MHLKINRNRARLQNQLVHRGLHVLEGSAKDAKVKKGAILSCIDTSKMRPARPFLLSKTQVPPRNVAGEWSKKIKNCTFCEMLSFYDRIWKPFQNTLFKGKYISNATFARDVMPKCRWTQDSFIVFLARQKTQVPQEVKAKLSWGFNSILLEM